MFASLKNKIKEETGSELPPHQRLNHNNNRIRGRGDSISDAGSEHYASLRNQCNELATKVTDLTTCLTTLQEEKMRIEKTNEILLETVKVAQTQKDIYCDEQEKIQNLQRDEIEKLQGLLSFREQEAVDRLGALRQNEQQIENLTTELERLKKFEHAVEDLQDEFETLRHSSEQGKNNLTTALAAVEEENRHLKGRVDIMEKARMDALSTLNKDEKIQALVHERKLLEQHLEEAHLQLSDIKSSWSGQNLALETQVSRLSKQVAEETTEKRKALKQMNDLNEKVKQLEFEKSKLYDELKQRDDKITLLVEELDDLNAVLKECREENEQQILYERNKVKILEQDIIALTQRIEAADLRLNEYAANAENMQQTLRDQLTQSQIKFGELQVQFEQEKEEKLTALLRNAEISQSEEKLKTSLRIEQEEVLELNEKVLNLKSDLKTKQEELDTCKQSVAGLENVVSQNEEKLLETEGLHTEIYEKTKTIKLLNQNLIDLKKSVHLELRNSNTFDIHLRSDKSDENGHVPTAAMRVTCSCGKNAAPMGAIIMDEVNFKYLKHVIVKFLTSREVEARHLIRAVSTLLRFSKEEEQILYDTLNWKMSWFGTKPNHGTGQHAFSIPPS